MCYKNDDERRIILEKQCEKLKSKRIVKHYEAGAVISRIMSFIFTLDS